MDYLISFLIGGVICALGACHQRKAPFGFLGLFQGGFKASAVGISAALVFGYLASLIFDPKMKK